MEPQRNIPGVQASTDTAGPAPSPGRTAEVALLPCADEHMEDVLRLYAQVFGPQAARDFQARGAWSQRQALAPGQALRWVLARGGAVVGYLGTVPLPYWVQGRPLLAHTPCDYMVRPDVRFHGIRLMQECFKTCHNIVSCDDMPATLQVSRWLGAADVAALVRWVKVLDARALRQRLGTLAPPSLLWRPLTGALRAADALRLPRPADVEVRPAGGFDARFDALAQALARVAPAMPARDARFLAWRYGDASPHARRELAVAHGPRDDLRGYMVLYVSRRRPPAAWVLDLQTLPPGDPAAAAALLADAVARARRRGAWTLRYHHLASPFSPPPALLRRLGFLPRGGHRLLVRLHDPALHAVAARPASWSYAFGDSEASHAIA